MKPKYRLKNWVVISVYTLAISAIVVSMFLLNRVLKESTYSDETLSYVYKGLLHDVIPVVNYQNNEIIKPFESEDVDILKSFYNKDADASVQEKSLIMYQNTYMPNTGVLYSSSQEFEILAVLDGTVADVVADEIMGNIVTIKHSNNLTTVYQSLNEVNVIVGDLIKQGDVIGTSGINKVESSSENMLLFEVINNGEYLNPEEFYNTNIKELS